MIYLDNAATSFPKPKDTIESLNHFVTSIGGNPGRGGHPLSVEAARSVFECREKLAELIGASSSERVIFTLNGTDSLNLAMRGLLNHGDHVITTMMEHNSVMRPLTFLQKSQFVRVSMVRCSPQGFIDLDHLRNSLTTRTKAVVINHGSNVTGTVQPLNKIREAVGSRLLIVDACQTVGNMPIDVEGQAIDVLCFSCHKALFGTQGVGALYIRTGVEPTPLRWGGTGSNSESIEQPDMLPDKYECGTPNSPGIAALFGGLTFIEKEGLGSIMARKRALRNRLIEGLVRLKGVTVYTGPEDPTVLPVVSANMAGVSPSEIGYECNQAGICVRVGLHCSPLAHQTIGTFPGGAVRMSPGYYNSEDDIDQVVEVFHRFERR
ncbi:MAG TPA: cysteine desulfurase [Deltaproteobacteria bacterium]|nr:cysteine desulfurase [Deltaproteobacteria bacterium]